jgi:acyl carrier protein
MNKQEIELRVIEITREHFGECSEEVTLKTSFKDDLCADSLDCVELLMEFEDEFEVSITDEEAEKISTVGESVDFISEKLGVTGGVQ